MKAITEYFRELAAEDRYFGVEPPQTQTDEATRLARHEVSRRIDAQGTDGSLPLRPRADRKVTTKGASVVEGADKRAEVPPAAVDVRLEASDADEGTPRAKDAPSQDHTRGPRQSDQDAGDRAVAKPAPSITIKTALDPDTAAKLHRIRELVGHRPKTAETTDTPAGEASAEQDHDQPPGERAEKSDTVKAETSPREGPDQHTSPPPDDLQIALRQIEREIRVADEDAPHATPDDAALMPGDDESALDIDNRRETIVPTEQTKPRLRSAVGGRVLKVDRADLEAALAAGEFGTRPRDTTTPRTSEAKLPPVDKSDADDVSRLMAEAEQKMGDPDGTTRRDAFAHLRAAVAARSVDESMQHAATEDETTRPYRHDLAQAIGPLRLLSAGQRAERPEDSAPAPLKLTPEQRVGDSPPDASRVTPRRIPAERESTLPAGIGFAAFAEAWGVTQLPDLLEAAAAHMRFVEGREVFSRPQLMTHARQADAENFHREEALRGFAKLLEAGKIEKIGSGRFQAADTIGFRPEKDAG
ncbi:hypothetical protein [Roseobacter cerasinus]|nr:hypothetical protein [Roseobacter cerasinus]